MGSWAAVSAAATASAAMASGALSAAARVGTRASGAETAGTVTSGPPLGWRLSSMVSRSFGVQRAIHNSCFRPAYLSRRITGSTMCEARSPPWYTRWVATTASSALTVATLSAPLFRFGR